MAQRLRSILLSPFGHRNEYDRRKAIAVLLAVLVLLYVFVRSDWGFRMVPRRDGGRGQPEPMV